MNRIHVTRAIIGLTNMQVCAVNDATDDEILAVCNRENVSGTTLGWTTVNRTGGLPSSPIKCESYDGRTHFLVSC